MPWTGRLRWPKHQMATEKPRGSPSCQMALSSRTTDAADLPMDTSSAAEALAGEDDVAQRDAWFDPWRRPGSSKAKEIVADVQRQMENYETHFALRKRRRRPADQEIFQESVAAVVCNLMHRELTVPGGKLGRLALQPTPWSRRPLRLPRHEQGLFQTCWNACPAPRWHG